MQRLNNNWAKLGGAAGLFILFLLPFTDLKWPETEYLLWIQFSFLLFHQFEEYIYPGGFKDFFNFNILNKNRITRFPLNNISVLLVNVALGWTAYPLCAYLNINFIWFALGLVLIMIFNGVLHSVVALFTKKYNPGLISGLFLLIPFGIFIILKLNNSLTFSDWLSGITVFISGALSIILIIFLSDKIESREVR